MLARDGLIKNDSSKGQQKLRELAMWISAGRAFLAEGASSKARGRNMCGVLRD